jgi:hypothetical protein
VRRPDRVERARRLVEKEQPRPADERLRDPEPLLCIPLDMSSTLRARIGETDELEELGPLRLAAVRCGQALVQVEELVGGVPAGEAEELCQIAQRGARRGEPAGAPATSAVPALGRTRPQAIFTSVDLPAPFGPSRPTSSPSATSRSTPPSAVTAPYRFARPCARNAATWPSLRRATALLFSHGPDRARRRRRGEADPRTGERRRDADPAPRRRRHRSPGPRRARTRVSSAPTPTSTS